MFDAAIAHIAQSQHGFVTWSQVQAAGGTRNHVSYRVRTGRWRRRARGVFRITGHPFTWESGLTAAVFCGGDGALASHRSAAVLWELDGFSRGRPEIVVIRHRRPRRLIHARVHEATDLELARPSRKRGIATTGIDRTLLDLGAVVGVRRVEAAIDCALRRRLTDWPRLYGTLVSHSRRGRDGCGAFREVLDARYGDKVIPQSRFERLVATLLTDSGVGPPELQHPVAGLFPWTIHLDLAYPEAKVGIELQSKAHHLNAEAFETDRERLTRLRLAGWTMLEFTWRFYVERPIELVAMVNTAIHGSGVS
ncbi:MAG: type IV toxin-antitoxin system AbiEi family antitoxin domain-containing protein [Acidimicrobiales bacterium]